MADRPFTDYHAFTGPNVAVSCMVEWDAEQERYVATAREGFKGYSPYSADAAALACFRMWLTGEGAAYEPAAQTDG